MTDAEKAAAEKAASDKAAADKTAKEKADGDAAAKAKADEKEKKGQSGADDKGGELAQVFDDDEKDGAKGKEAPPSKKGDATELKVSVPDDLKDLFPAKKVEAYLAWAREEGLTQKQLDGWMARHADDVRAAVQDANAHMERSRLDVKRELMSDPKLGGANLKQTLQTAERGARALGGSSLAVKLLKHVRGEETIDGATLVRAFHMAGLEIQEDRLGDQGRKPASKDDDAGLTPDERTFKRTNPETWRRMQEEKRSRSAR